MTAAQRRTVLLRALTEATQPISASALAEQCGVSRQIIVGDVALLRAGGSDILATPRGYVLARSGDWLVRRVACQHDAAGTEQELCIMVDNGCTVRDVIVEHSVYGQLTGLLELRSRYDVAQYLERAAGSAPLCSLTDGIHLHTLLCPDETAFQRTKAALAAAGFLLEERD